VDEQARSTWKRLGPINLSDGEDIENGKKWVEDEKLGVYETRYTGYVNEDGEPHGWGRKENSTYVIEGQWMNGEQKGLRRLINQHNEYTIDKVSI